MKATNPPTQQLLAMFKKRSEEQPHANEGHPYFSALTAAQTVGLDPDSDSFRESTLRAMAVWAGMTIASIIGDVMNEISAAGKAASDGDDDSQKAAADLLSSMDFVAGVFQSWANSVDLEHVAEVIFEDGERRRKAGNSADSSLPDPASLLAEFQEKLEKLALNKLPKGQKAKKSDVPVTPSDIMKMLFEKSTKPSVN